MEKWGQDKRRDVVLVDIDQLVPADHMLRKIEKIMDYEWLYERLNPYYCHDNGRPGTDPVVLIKMVLLQHLYGSPSLRQTRERVNDTVSYRWFLGYSLLDKLPHFATVSYAFCQRFPAEGRRKRRCLRRIRSAGCSRKVSMSDRLRMKPIRRVTRTG